jgi:hypothetical protein
MDSPGGAKSLERRKMQPGATNPANLRAGEIDGDRKSPGAQGIGGDAGCSPRSGRPPWPASHCLSDRHQEQPPLNNLSGSISALGFH